MATRWKNTYPWSNCTSSAFWRQSPVSESLGYDHSLLTLGQGYLTGYDFSGPGFLSNLDCCALFFRRGADPSMLLEGAGFETGLQARSWPAEFHAVCKDTIRASCEVSFSHLLPPAREVRLIHNTCPSSSALTRQTPSSTLSTASPRRVSLLTRKWSWAYRVSTQRSDNVVFISDEGWPRSPFSL